MLHALDISYGFILKCTLVIQNHTHGTCYLTLMIIFKQNLPENLLGTAFNFSLRLVAICPLLRSNLKSVDSK